MKKTEIYSPNQFYEAYPDGIQYNYWNVARNNIIYSKISGGKSILDIGCGRGVVVDFLRHNKKAAFGCELASPEPINTEAKSFIFYNTDFADLPEDFRDDIDTVLICDVLEHVKEPKGFIRKVLDNFKNLKTILITLPARTELWSDYDAYFGHYSRYDRKSAANMLSEIECKRVEIGYFFHLLYLPLLIMPKRNMYFKAPKYLFLQKILGKILYYEEKLLPKSLFGSSIYMLINF